jgi:uncharacterized membrane protein
LGYFGLLFLALIGVAIIGIAGLVYFLLFPDSKPAKPKIQDKALIGSYNVSPIESIRKTLTEDELKILEVLENHKGKYLQKYLTKESGLSRLKTHRILARFEKRGLVTLKKIGNTNEVRLKEWLKS